MKRQHSAKQIKEAIAFWKDQLKKGNFKRVNEGMTADTAIEEGNAIDEDIRSNVSNPGELEDWMIADTLHDVLDYSEEDNCAIVERYVQEIEWEHGDIDDGDDTPIAYERYFRALLSAFKSGSQSAMKRWLKSEVNDYMPSHGYDMEEDESKKTSKRFSKKQISEDSDQNEEFHEVPYEVGEIVWDTYEGEKLEPVKIKKVMKAKDGTLEYECYTLGNGMKIISHFSLEPFRVC